MLTRPMTHSDWGKLVVVWMRESCVHDNQACDPLRLGQGRSGVHEAELCKC